jgi:hypothetical protein
MMRVLIGCEQFGVVREAMRKYGHAQRDREALERLGVW